RSARRPACARNQETVEDTMSERTKLPPTEDGGEPATAPPHVRGARRRSARGGPRRGIAVVLAVGLAASVSAGAGLPAVADDRPATAQAPVPAPAEWGECPADVVVEALPYELDCATVQVPLDYARPDGEQIDL